MTKEKTKKPQPKIIPKPGSKEAIRDGCTCPVVDNHCGKGWDGGGELFVYNLECPLHKEIINPQDND